eukprot:CAMPEP_0115045708 /NCGR_PEP_ID=MMETSP0216-20121206/48303_1 /TAXON_ID=223996 /ORGANISM="Protocruzia adherens, Strain Boccale" /LENGTH=98 /DNA_ID=CAMNT_0002428627 /DNA_START=785 /DNA_END=1081 /DNA_ORIENTATION=-
MKHRPDLDSVGSYPLEILRRFLAGEPKFHLRTDKGIEDETAMTEDKNVHTLVLTSKFDQRLMLFLLQQMATGIIQDRQETNSAPGLKGYPRTVYAFFD